MNQLATVHNFSGFSINSAIRCSNRPASPPLVQPHDRFTRFGVVGLFI
jgi:hypothetical protein